MGMNYAENIIYILAGLPDFLRKPMLKRRLEEFFLMSKEEKEEVIENVLKALPEINAQTLRKIIMTWIEVLNQFNEEQRIEIFRLYAFILPTYINNIDLSLLIDIFNKLDGNIKENIARDIRKSIEILDNERKYKLLSSLSADIKLLIDL
jgi:hypothetical protein